MSVYQERGFTLVEAVITVLIAAIFLAFAVPGYYALIQNNKIVTTTNRFSATFHMARMEAVKRGLKVAVCSAASSALNTCGTLSQWGSGWIIFIDGDGNNSIETNNDLINVNEAVPDGVTVTANRRNVGYDSAGFLSSPGLTLTITASGCTGNSARQMTISTSGRLTITPVACS